MSRSRRLRLSPVAGRLPEILSNPLLNLQVMENMRPFIGLRCGTEPASWARHEAHERREKEQMQKVPNTIGINATERGAAISDHAAPGFRSCSDDLPACRHDCVVVSTDFRVSASEREPGSANLRMCRRNRAAASADLRVFSGDRQAGSTGLGAFTHDCRGRRDSSHGQEDPHNKPYNQWRMLMNRRISQTVDMLTRVFDFGRVNLARFPKDSRGKSTP